MKRKKPDWETALKTLLIFGIIIGAIYFFELPPGIFRLGPQKKQESQTKAQVIGLRKIFSSHATTAAPLKAIALQYKYVVDKHDYFGNDIIPYLGAMNVLWIDSLLHTRADSVWIRYSTNEPGRCLVKVR